MKPEFNPYGLRAIQIPKPPLAFAVSELRRDLLSGSPGVRNVS